MTLRWYLSTSTGVVLDISDRVHWPNIEVGAKANQDAWEGDLIVDDPAGNLIPLMYRRIYAVQDAAPAGDQNVGNWFITNLKVRRTGTPMVGVSRTWVITMADENSLLSRRKFVGSDSNRPAEDDITRLRWALTTTELNVLSPDETYIDTSGPVNLDAADLRTQGPDELMSSLMAASGKQYWVKYEEAAIVGGTIVSSSVANPSVITTSTVHGLYTGMQVVIAGHAGSTPAINGTHTITVTGVDTFTIPVNVTVGGTGGTVSTVGRYVLWYSNQTEPDSLYYASAALSNVASEVGVPETTLIWALSGDAELDRAGGRMASGLVAPYKTAWIYLQDTAVGNTYAYVDRTAGDFKNVSTVAKATAQVTRELAELNLPDDEGNTIWTVGEADLNRIRHGQIVQVHATHWPNYTDDSDPTLPGYLLPGYAAAPVPMRVMERTIRQVGPDTFEVPLRLSPMRVPLCPDYTTTPTGFYAPLSVSGTIVSTNAITGAEGVIYYWRPGNGPPTVPTPGSSGVWTFPVVSPTYQRVVDDWPSGYGDFAANWGQNVARLILVGDGTATVYIGDSAYPTGIDDTRCIIYDHTNGGETVLYDIYPIAHVTTGAGGGGGGETREIVLTGAASGVCLHIIDLLFTNSTHANFFGFGGVDWTAA